MLKKSWLYKFGIVVLLLLIRALLCNVPTAYAESGKEEAVSSISEIDSKKEEPAAPTRMVYNPNTTASNKIDVYLGVTKDIVSWLKSHEKDNYYLGTKYVGTINAPATCVKPRGEYTSGSGMNCTGFVASVLKKNGADLAKLTQRLHGSYANACNWQDTAHQKNCRTYRFTSIKEMLASGKLEKGDIIYFEPDWQDAGDDCHIGFFWGNTSSDNKFWHSTAEHGNAITEIKAKSEFTYVYIFKTQKRGSLQIVKTSADDATKGNTSYTLCGAVYKLYNASGSVAAVLTTDENGTAKVDNLPVGTYTLKEVTAPHGYKLDETDYKITIKNGEKTTKSLKEEPRYGWVELSKSSSNLSVTSGNNNYSLKGAVYKLYSGSKVVATLTTDENGYAVAKNILAGVYTLKESSASKGYKVDTVSYKVVVNADKGTVKKVEEQPALGSLSIVKSSSTSDIDSSNTNYSLKDAVYKLYDKTGKTVAELKTDEKGVASAENLPLGAYTLKEVTAPKGFKLDTKEYLVTIDGAVVKKMQLKDVPIRGWVQIYKSSADTSITNGNSQYSLEGAVYKLYKEKQVVATLTIDKDGYAVAKNIPAGSYTLKEVTAPKGYAVDKVSYNVTVKLGEKTTLRIKETPLTGEIELVKTSSDKSTTDSNSNYSLKDAVYKLYDKAGKTIATLRTDVNGKASAKNIPLGTYVLKEVTAPKGFHLDTKEYSVTIDGAVVKKMQLKDVPIRGWVQIYKSSADTSITNGNNQYSLEGAVYKLYKEKQVVATLTTDKDGYAVAKNIPAGSYTLKEVTAPKGYRIDTVSYNVIVNVGQKTTIKIKEVPQNGSLELIKISSNENVTNGNECYHLEGAEYELYRNGNVVAVLKTNEKGCAQISKLPIGEYELLEKKAPEGYEKDKKKYKVTIGDGKIVSVKVKDDPVVYRIDASILGKVDKETDQNVAQGSATLANAEFELKYFDGVFSQKELEGKKEKKKWVLKTDSNGECKLEESYKISGDLFYYDSEGKIVIPKGTLTVSEVKAPDGYLINEEIFVRNFGDKKVSDDVVVYQKIKIPEMIKKGNLKIKKYGANPDNIQEKYSLQGVKFEITSKTTGEKNEIVTDENGEASTETIGGLVYDSYEIREIEAPENYVQSSKSFEISIKEDEELLVYEVVNYEKRASVQILKKDAESKKCILESGVKFRVLDKDQKVIYENVETDENGVAQLPGRLALGEYYIEEVLSPKGYLADGKVKFTVDKEADSENPIVVEVYNEPIKGIIKLQKVESEGKNPLCEVKFHVIAAENIKTKDGRIHAQKGDVVDLLVTDQQGIACSKKLYLGKYYVTEIETLKGYILNSEPIEVTLECENREANMVTKDLGQIENNRDLRPRIVETNLVDGKQKSHYLCADEEISLHDMIEYTNLKKGHKYIIDGILMDYETGKPLLLNEKEITSSLEFTAEDEDGSVVIEYKFDGSDYAGKKIVAFERLSCGGEMLDEHVDLDDVKQTVYIPKITTNAYDGKTKKKIGIFERDTCLKDMVYYYNLIEGEEYVLKGVVMDKKTGENTLIAGKTIEVEKHFIAESENGMVLVEFNFDGSMLEESELVVYEYLYQNDNLIAEHEELQNLDQTVVYKVKKVETPSEPVEEPEEPEKPEEPEEVVEPDKPEEPEETEEPEKPEEPEEIVEPEKPEEPEEQEEEYAPLTGDNRNLMIFILCFTLSCVTLIKCVRMTRKNK